MGMRWGVRVLAVGRIVLATVMWAPFTAWSAIPPDQCTHPEMEATTPSNEFIPLAGESLVRHLATGLEWQRCSLGQRWQEGRCVGEAKLLTWPEARTLAEEVGDGWRLPDTSELQSIVEYCRISPAANRQVFPDHPMTPSNVWSSMPYAGTARYVWSYRFSTGQAMRGRRISHGRVRWVRDGPLKRQMMFAGQMMHRFFDSLPGKLVSAHLEWKLPNGLLSAAGGVDALAEAGFSAACFREANARQTPSSDFSIIGDGDTVRHRSTGLEWQRCTLGQTWNEGRCEGEAETFDWQDAREVAAQAEDGWRLPTVGELLTIVEPCRSRPAVNRALFPDIPQQPSAYWSALPFARSETFAWNVDFADGSSDWTRRSAQFRIRLVRD